MCVYIYIYEHEWEKREMNERGGDQGQSIEGCLQILRVTLKIDAEPINECAPLSWLPWL